VNSPTRAGERRLPIIAIDGPAGAGKTTTARQVAERLGFLHLDTGAMYRALALKVLRAGCPLDRPREIARIAQTTEVSIRLICAEPRIFLENEDVSDLIRSPEVTGAVSPVCEVPEVRSRMVQLQRKLGEKGGVVVEGRDIGTVVFPDAELKIFLTADLNVRARRRRKDLEKAGTDGTLDAISADLEQRDRRDQERNNSPLKRAPDAVLVDTTHLSFDEQVEEILQLFNDL